jgi:succinylglutamate desuccinylase
VRSRFLSQPLIRVFGGWWPYLLETPREEVRRQQEALRRVQDMFSERQRHIHQLNARHSTTVSQLTKSLSDLNGKNTYNSFCCFVDLQLTPFRA